jgi:DNA-binding Lrp family transcriptional regulator
MILSGLAVHVNGFGSALVSATKRLMAAWRSTTERKTPRFNRTGEYDYLVKVAVAGTEHYERFLRESLYRIEGIQHSRSTFALRALKRAISIAPLQMR